MATEEEVPGQRLADDFAEASIEAISLAALRNTTNQPADDDTFPSQPLTTTQSFSPMHSLSLTHSKDPALWHHHLITLPHNALRAELVDLCAMLHAIPTRGKHWLVPRWFPRFYDFIVGYLAFEDEVLLPWIFAGAADGLLDVRKALAREKEHVLDLLEELCHTLALYRTRPASHVTPLLVRCVRDLVHPTLAYLEREERMFPSIIRATRTREEAVNVERLMARRLDAGLLLRWIPGRERASVRRRLLSGKGWITWMGSGRRTLADHLSVVREVVG